MTQDAQKQTCQAIHCGRQLDPEADEIHEYIGLTFCDDCTGYYTYMDDLQEHERRMDERNGPTITTPSNRSETPE